MNVLFNYWAIFVSGKGNNGKLEAELKSVQDSIKWTFRSILLMNWILIGIGVVMFGAAVYSALWLQRWDITSVLALTGFGDILTVFKFSMNRVQRCLGDQVQVYTAAHGQLKQMYIIEKLGSNANVTINDIKRINEEIRRATLYSMELIQDFTKIAEPIKEKPWIRALPIRYGPLKLNGKPIIKEFTVIKGKPITLSGTIINVSNKEIKLNKTVIAIRPPGGTPDGGPWRFDFFFNEDPTIIKPKKSVEMTYTKVIEYNMRTKGIEPIPKEWFTKDWYVFMTCQTEEDRCWHDDHNTYWFELKKTEPKK